MTRKDIVGDCSEYSCFSSIPEIHLITPEVVSLSSLFKKNGFDSAVGVHANFGAMASSEPSDSFKVLKVREHHEEVIRDMISRDKNHPCVVMWSLSNESDTTTFPESSVEYYSSLYELVKECDPEKRPTTIVGVQNDY